MELIKNPIAASSRVYFYKSNSSIVIYDDGSVVMANDGVESLCRESLNCYNSYLRDRDIDIIVNVASRYHAQDSSCEELAHSGILGLVEAVHHSKKARGWDFDELVEWYASQNILESIAITSLKIPNWQTKLRKRIKTIKNNYSKKYEISPSIFQITYFLNKNTKKIYSPCQINRLIKLYEPSELFLEGIRQRIGESMAKLEPAEREVITKTFYECLDNGRIAAETGINRDKVDELYKSGMNRLTKEFKEEFSGDDCIVARYCELMAGKL